MMEAKNLPPNFWAEAINCASYIHNRLPHKNLDGMTVARVFTLACANEHLLRNLDSLVAVQ